MAVSPVQDKVSDRAMFRATPVSNLMTSVHVYGCDVDLFKRAFLGEMSQVTVRWPAYHACAVDLIQGTLYLEKIDTHRRCIRLAIFTRST